VSTGVKVSCTASHSPAVGKEQESLKVRNFASIEENELSTKNHLLSCFMFYMRNNRSEDSFEHVAFLTLAVLKVAKLTSFLSKTSFFGERRGQKERSGTSKILPESFRVFPLHL